jgi:ferredoxin
MHNIIKLTEKTNHIKKKSKKISRIHFNQIYLQAETNLNLITMAYKINEDCTACGTCLDECPVEAIKEGDIYTIDPETCTDCGACADVCPVEAIHPE